MPETLDEKPTAEISYAKVHGPPADWRGLCVFDADTGEEIQDVIEVDASNGWLVRYKMGDDGHAFIEGDEVAKETLTGRFRIERRNGSSD